MGTGQADEVAKAFGRNGWTNAEVKKLCGGDFLARVLQVVRGTAEITVIRHPAALATELQGALTAPAPEPAQKLLDGEMPTTMTIAGRTYDLLGFLRGDEKSVRGTVMVDRAKEMSAHLGADDGRHLLDHQDEIPVALRGKIVFVFTDWRHPGGSVNVYYVYWSGSRWVRDWDWLDFGWDGFYRVLCRK